MFLYYDMIYRMIYRTMCNIQSLKKYVLHLSIHFFQTVVKWETDCGETDRVSSAHSGRGCK